MYSTRGTSAPVVLPPLKKHSATVIFLHGLGDSGSGWEDGAELFQQVNPHVKFILPNAPMRRITVNNGMAMPGWYDIKSFDKTGTDDLDGLTDARNIISRIIDEEVAAGIPSERIMVGGFSQGAVVSLFTVYQHAKPLAGCIVLSGYLAMADKFREMINSANADTPFIMFHGESDTLIPAELGRRSYALLQQAGLKGTFTGIPFMPHSATSEELLQVGKFIRERIPE